MAIDFTRYQPPGIYAEDLGGPQLAVRSSVPIAVAIFGRSAGYKTSRESVTIPADVGGNPSNSEKLSKQGVKFVSGDPVVFATENVSLTNPPETIEGLVPGESAAEEVNPANNDLVYLTAQTAASENGLYKYGETTSGQTVTRTLTRESDFFRVTNPTTGQVYVRGLDYEIVTLGIGLDVESARDNEYAIKRKDRGVNVGIQPGELVQVYYRYTDPEYHNVQVFYDYDDVRDFYGEPFNPDATIRSELTLAARFALLNGASTVMTAAVDEELKDEEGNDLSLLQCYQKALDRFLDEGQIAIIVPATGDQAVHEMVRSHVSEQSAERFERRAILGTDGTTTTIGTEGRIEAAQTVSHRRIAMVSPSKFDYQAPELTREIKAIKGQRGYIQLGGQFAAAAVAGRSVSQIAAMPLTRKILYGISPSPAPVHREGDKNLETSNGLLVVERTRRNQVQIRHGVTTDPTDLISREWSITGQQDVMVYRVRDYLDADGLIGMPIYDTTLIQVKASAEAALVSLVRDQIIVGYRNLKVRQLATLPDVVEVRYEWQPAYPLNYIVVRYSVAVMTGDVTVDEATVTSATPLGQQNTTT